MGGTRPRALLPGKKLDLQVVSNVFHSPDNFADKSRIEEKEAQNQLNAGL